MFPKKHSFPYSYVVVGVPVGCEGAAGGMASACRERDVWPFFLVLIGVIYTGNHDAYGCERLWNVEIASSVCEANSMPT